MKTFKITYFIGDKVMMTVTHLAETLEAATEAAKSGNNLAKCERFEIEEHTP